MKNDSKMVLGTVQQLLLQVGPITSYRSGEITPLIGSCRGEKKTVKPIYHRPSKKGAPQLHEKNDRLGAHLEPNKK